MDKTPFSFTREKLQKEYINQDMRDDYLQSIEYSNEWINTTFKKALEDEGIPFNLEVVKRISTKSEVILDIVLEHARNYITTLGVIPTIERDRIFALYHDIADRLKEVCYKLYVTAHNHKHSLTEDKNGLVEFNPKEVKDHVSTLGIKTFTEEEIAYMNMLQDAAELLVKIAKHEVEKDFNPFVLQRLSEEVRMGFTPSKVFQERSIKKYNVNNLNQTDDE